MKIPHTLLLIFVIFLLIFSVQPVRSLEIDEVWKEKSLLKYETNYSIATSTNITSGRELISAVFVAEKESISVKGPNLFRGDIGERLVYLSPEAEYIESGNGVLLYTNMEDYDDIGQSFPFSPDFLITDVDIGVSDHENNEMISQEVGIGEFVINGTVFRINYVRVGTSHLFNSVMITVDGVVYQFNYAYNYLLDKDTGVTLKFSYSQTTSIIDDGKNEVIEIVEAQTKIIKSQNIRLSFENTENEGLSFGYIFIITPILLVIIRKFSER